MWRVRPMITASGGNGPSSVTIGSLAPAIFDDHSTNSSAAVRAQRDAFADTTTHLPQPLLDTSVILPPSSTAAPMYAPSMHPGFAVSSFAPAP